MVSAYIRKQLTCICYIFANRISKTLDNLNNKQQER